MTYADISQPPTHFMKHDEVSAFARFLGTVDDVIGFDVEGTGLDPYATGFRVRTSQYYSEAVHDKYGGPVVIDHDYCGSFRDTLNLLRLSGATTFFVYNAGYEGRCIDALGFTVGEEGMFYLYDTALMRKARLGGGFNLSFAQALLTDISVEISKEQQRSDWSVPVLSKAQIDYAAGDAFWTYHYGKFWSEELKRTGTLHGFMILNDAVPGSVAMENLGMTIDPEYHETLIRLWTLRRDTAEAVIRKLTPDLANIRSKKQVGAIISAALDDASLAAWPKTGKTKQLDLTRKALTQASYRAPYPFSRWLAALMVFNRADKYLGTYGEKLLTIQRMAGCIRARFNIAAAITGRYSSSEPNLQNIPRAKLVRKSFVARKGARLVIGDYSGVELRILAELTDDEQLKQDVIYGNVHAENAVLITKAVRETFFKQLENKESKAVEARTRAKAFSFQLTYGASPPALAVVLRCSDDAAAEHVSRWAARYPNAYNYRYETANKMQENGGFIWTKGGRTIYLPKWKRTIPKAANYGVQGAGADVMYRAVTRMHSWCQRTGKAQVLASVHDELITTCSDDPDTVDEVVAAQTECMELAWLDVFPGSSIHKLLEIGHGLSWAAK